MQTHTTCNKKKKRKMDVYILLFIKKQRGEREIFVLLFTVI
jgi:hypothetical protein